VDAQASARSARTVDPGLDCPGHHHGSDDAMGKGAPRDDRLLGLAVCVLPRDAEVRDDGGDVERRRDHPRRGAHWP